jgi:uncharacterized protein (DUF4415 family)
MPTQRQRAARAAMMYELEALQDDLNIHWLDQSLPDDWTGLDWREPVTPHRTRVTIRLDSDMVRWFRKLGPGYGPRINRVLRIYWLALMAGHIKGFPADNTTPRLLAEANRIREELAESGGDVIE